MYGREIKTCAQCVKVKPVVDLSLSLHPSIHPFINPSILCLLSRVGSGSSLSREAQTSLSTATSSRSSRRILRRSQASPETSSLQAVLGLSGGKREGKSGIVLSGHKHSQMCVSLVRVEANFAISAGPLKTSES